MSKRRRGSLAETLCPDEKALAKAVAVRKRPGMFAKAPAVREYAGKLCDAVQRYADVGQAGRGR